jgi:hypothetical protein
MLLWNKLQVLNPQGALTRHKKTLLPINDYASTLHKELATLVIPIARIFGWQRNHKVFDKEIYLVHMAS